MLFALVVSLCSAFPQSVLPFRRSSHHPPDEYRHVFKVHRQPKSDLKSTRTFNIKRIPKHPKIDVVSTSSRSVLTTSELPARKICVTDNVAIFGAGFCAGQPTGGVASGPAALKAAGVAEAIGNLGKLLDL